MQIQDFEIQNSFGFLFNYISTDIKQRLETELRKHDVTILQFAILLNVYKQGPFLQKELVRYTNGDEPSTTRLVERLENKGFLRREQDATDKRKKLVHATVQTETLLNELLPYAIANNEETVALLDAEERQQLLHLLKKVAGIEKNWAI